MITVGQVDHLHDLDQLVELLGDLLDDIVRAGGHDRHTRHRCVLGRRDGERLDIVAARGKKPGDPGQCAGLVLDQNR